MAPRSGQAAGAATGGSTSERSFPAPELIEDMYQAWVRVLAAWARRHVIDELITRAGVEIDPLHTGTLHAIVDNAPLRLGELASATHMTASNASKIVEALVSAGLVTRRVPGDDRRVTLIEPTPAGRHAVARLNDAGRTMLAERLSGFTPEEVVELERLLCRFADEVAKWSAELGNGGKRAFAPAR